MRFPLLAIQALWGTAPLAAALVAVNYIDDPDQHTCCCCDLETQDVVCTTGRSDSNCFCLEASVCPKDASTTWRNLEDESQSTLPPSSPQEAPSASPSDADIDCCCCNIGDGAIVCDRRPEEEGCICPLVLCPPNAPTVWLEPTTTPTRDPALLEPVKKRGENVSQHGRDEEETVDCCCCDTSKNVIACSVQPAELGCFCAAVVCHSGAPTVWIDGPRETTSGIEAPSYT